MRVDRTAVAASAGPECNVDTLEAGVKYYHNMLGVAVRECGLNGSK